MSLLERLTNDMKQAMKNKEKVRLSVIRMVKASIQNEMIHKGVDRLEPEDELTILSRELKQRKDSLPEFEAANRQDLVGKLKDEIVILKQYLPEQLSEEEIEQLVIQTIETTGATTKSDMGKVMGSLMPKVKGKADGTLVNKIVMKHLQS